MECVKELDAIAYVNGELSAPVKKQISLHVSGCDACSALISDCRRIQEGLSEHGNEFHDAALTSDIMTLIDMGRGQPSELPTMVAKPQRFLPAIAAAAVLFITFATIMLKPLLSPPDREMTGVAARGDNESLDDWVSLELFRRDEQNDAIRYIPIGDHISTSAAVAVAYEDRSDKPFAWLMVFAVDGLGEIHWYYPEFSEDNGNPMSISTSDTGRDTLPDEVVHNLPEGPLTFFGIFSQNPLSVTEVEAEINRQWNIHDSATHFGRLNFEGCGQWSKSLTVVKSIK